MDVVNAIEGRLSVREYLDRDVSEEMIRTILETARWAPSGGNMQPWRVAVVKGETKQRITDAIIEARESKSPENPDYIYYPEEWTEPYKERRKACGIALYKALDIGRKEIDRMTDAWYNNYRFFGAPVGLLFFIERHLTQGSWVDMGIFMQSIMLTAKAHGLDTCPQASLADYPDLVRDILNIEDNWALLGGLSLGYGDPDAAVNNYRTEREEVDNFTEWYV